MTYGSIRYTVWHTSVHSILCGNVSSVQCGIFRYKPNSVEYDIIEWNMIVSVYTATIQFSIRYTVWHTLVYGKLCGIRQYTVYCVTYGSIRYTVWHTIMSYSTMWNMTLSSGI